MSDIERVRRCYDAVADEYVDRIHDELKDKPFDREWLRDFAERARPLAESSPICDLGCGPGHVGQFIFDQGCEDVIGVDLSRAMVERASGLHPRIDYSCQDMRRLVSFEDDYLAAIIAFYALVNLDAAGREETLRTAWRVLLPVRA